jgi:HK97 family phage major capsid protein
VDPELKAVTDGITSTIAEYKQAQTNLQIQVDALDRAARTGMPHPNGITQKSLVDHLKDSSEISALRESGRGTARLMLKGADAAPFLQTKATLLESGMGYSTTGVLPIQRLPGIVVEARPRLFLRDLLQARPTTAAVVDFVKVSTGVAIASPQTEGNAKAENALVLTSVSERIKTIATWLPVSRQAFDDLDELAAFISTSLQYAVSEAEELQLISADGTAENLHGLISQASAFNAGLLVPAKGWSKIDLVARAQEQISIAKEIDPTFVILNPVDWADVKLTKDSLGRYLYGDPSEPGPSSIWGLTPLVTPNIAAGSFLVGSSSPVAMELRDRMELLVEISDSHSTFFTQNLYAVRAERRTALVVYRPNSLVYGTFTTSP